MASLLQGWEQGTRLLKAVWLRTFLADSYAKQRQSLVPQSETLSLQA